MLLETRQLTPTQFADAIGIARPIVSHILSGRNKPSLEVVQRILAAMPTLSMPWLLNGTGTMLATATDPADAPKPAVAPHAHDQEVVIDSIKSRQAAPPAPETSPVRHRTSASVLLQSAPNASHAATEKPRRFTSSTPKATRPTAVADAPATLASSNLETQELMAASQLPPVVMEQSEVTRPDNAPLTAPVSPFQAAAFAAPDKAIRRIVVFYWDGSFADYQPE